MRLVAVTHSCQCRVTVTGCFSCADCDCQVYILSSQPNTLSPLVRTRPSLSNSVEETRQTQITHPLYIVRTVGATQRVGECCVYRQLHSELRQCVCCLCSPSKALSTSQIQQLERVMHLTSLWIHGMCDQRTCV